MTTAEIIAIGTELLLGETVDTNTSYIARTLRSLGINVYRTQIIGDNAARIAELINDSLERSDFVITTGGLGPTVDDPTREAVSIATGELLEFHSELWDKVKARMSRFGRIPTENQKRQAYIPHNAMAINNPVGTAPAFIIERGNKSIICLPGVPREMELLLNNAVLPYLHEFFKINETIQVRTLHVSGVGEGILDERIGDLEILSNPTVGLTSHPGIVSIRITAKGRNNREVNKYIAKIEKEIRDRLGNDIFGADDETLEMNTFNLLKQLGWTLACVEYQTEDYIQNRLSRIANTSFLGGITLNSLEKSLSAHLEEYVATRNASVGLAVACFKETRKEKALLALQLPNQKEERELQFGGHPDNLNLWAFNLSLDWLRRSAMEVLINAK